VCSGRLGVGRVGHIVVGDRDHQVVPLAHRYGVAVIELRDGHPRIVRRAGPISNPIQGMRPRKLALGWEVFRGSPRRGPRSRRLDRASWPSGRPHVPAGAVAAS